MATRPIPAVVSGTTYRRETPLGTIRVVVNTVDGEPFEIFLILGRAGSEVQSFAEALGRTISVALRFPGPIPASVRLATLADQLTGIGGAHQVGFGPQRVLSVVDAVGQILRAIETAVPNEVGATPEPEPTAVPVPVPAVPTPVPLATSPAPTSLASPTRDLCPECAGPGLVFSEGCQHCEACGYSRC